MARKKKVKEAALAVLSQINEITERYFAGDYEDEVTEQGPMTDTEMLDWLGEYGTVVMMEYGPAGKRGWSVNRSPTIGATSETSALRLAIMYAVGRWKETRP
jgi:hypothetical protein